MSLKQSIFKEYDIRGLAEEDLHSDAVQKIGRAIGSYFLAKDENRVILCRDARLSSARIANEMAQALKSTGCHVTDIGMQATPLCYFATKHLDISASVMVTASHNPAEYNGFKINSEGMSIYGDEIQKIYHAAQSGDFRNGEGSVEIYADIEEDYIKYIRQNITLARPLRIAIDAGNGASGPVACKIFRALGCEVEALYCEPDGRFPNHHPDPTIPENLADMRAVVLEKGLDLGLGFDGDGDRLGVIDDKGNIIWGDVLQVLFWREIMQKHPGSDVLVEVKCSRVLFDEAKKMGGNPFFYKTGHSLIKALMKQRELLFAGEMSGHLFFADEYYGFDDAVYAGARLLRLLGDGGDRLSQMLGDLPQYHITPEMRIPCEEEEKDSLIDSARMYYQNKNMDITTVDGVRVNFANGWGLLRKSNTQPIIVMRAEADTAKGLETIVADLRKALKAHKSGGLHHEKGIDHRRDGAGRFFSG